ncbi:MAG: hypothetical protein FJ297_07180 [Planctomycetes bacterium]|nr:hypothetical protein [Planctomycetota bacterium]
MNLARVVHSFATLRPRAITFALVAWSTVVSTTEAQTEGRTEPVPLSMGGPAGARIFRPGRWSQVGIEIANPTDEPARLAATFHFRAAPDLHFRRELHLPANARRLTTCNVLTPDLDEREASDRGASPGSYDIECVVTMETPQGTRTLTDYGGALKRTTTVFRNGESITSAMFPDDVLIDTAYPTPYEMLIAARIAAGRTRRTGEFSEPLFPDSLDQLDAVDQILLQGDKAFSHPATVGALRDWLLAGGRLWIMLDRVDESNVRWLLGDQYQCAVVDRVELTEVRMAPALFGSGDYPAVSFERPVPMVRVETRDVETAHRVDGWPASFIRAYGKGRVLFTTVGPEAWVRLYEPNERRPPDADRQAAFVATAALDELSGLLFSPTTEHPFSAEDVGPYLAEQIGYRVVSRTPVALILAIFVLGLIAIGWIRRGFPSSVPVWAAPGLALLAAAPIGFLGFSRQSQVPPTAAVSQVAIVHPDSPWMHVAGSTAFYQREPGEVPVASDRGVLWMPDGHGLEGVNREIAWHDRDAWRWTRLRLPAGVREARYRTSVTLAEPVHVDVTFGPRGVEGSLRGLPIQNASDAVMVVPGGPSLAIAYRQDGSFVGAPGARLAKGEFVAESLINDEQRRRRHLMASMMDRRQTTRFPDRPMLMIWGDPFDRGLDLPSGYQRAGSALYCVPIRFEKPASGAHVALPASFLPYRMIAGPTGRGVATTYQAATGEWVATALASDSWLRAQVPEVVLPIVLSKLVIQLSIHAPSRAVRLAALRDGEIVTLLERANPTGTIQHVVEDADLLRTDPNGGIVLGLLVGESTDAKNRSPLWTVQELHVTAEGDVP